MASLVTGHGQISLGQHSDEQRIAFIFDLDKARMHAISPSTPVVSAGKVS
jgi:hypothetical protein